MTGTSVRAVSEQAEQVPTQSGLFAFQIRILRGAAIGKSNKTSVSPIESKPFPSNGLLLL